MRVGCEVVYGTDGDESCMGWGARLCMEQVMSNHVWGEMRGRAWNRWCGIVYWDEVRGRVWKRWCRIVYGVRCEVV